MDSVDVGTLNIQRTADLHFRSGLTGAAKFGEKKSSAIQTNKYSLGFLVMKCED